MPPRAPTRVQFLAAAAQAKSSCCCSGQPCSIPYRKPAWNVSPAPVVSTTLATGDAGASAVELAIITAIVLGIAAALLVVIQTFVGKEQTKISGTNG